MQDLKTQKFTGAGNIRGEIPQLQFQSRVIANLQKHLSQQMPRSKQMLIRQTPHKLFSSTAECRQDRRIAGTSGLRQSMF
jgi:hypothetical protein